MCVQVSVSVCTLVSEVWVGVSSLRLCPLSTLWGKEGPRMSVVGSWVVVPRWPALFAPSSGICQILCVEHALFI